MHLSLALNYMLGSCLIIVLIGADTLRIRRGDTFQRSLFLETLLLFLAAMLYDFVSYLLAGGAGLWTRRLLYLSETLYYFFQISGFYYIFIFFNYSIFKNTGKTKTMRRLSWMLFFVHALILLINLPLGFYFYFDETNSFFYGKGYFLRLLISYIPAALAAYDAFSALKLFKRNEAFLNLVFLLFCGIGSVAAFIFGTTIFLWSCISAGVLYVYFFILKSDIRTDALTGIGSRYAFNEFIYRLDHQNTKESYTFAMIDMDHFKEINDTLGHQEGDNALKDMAGLIKNRIHKTDFAARYGGDEFIIAVRGGGNIERLMEKIQKDIDKLNKSRKRPYQLQMSYGCGEYTTHADQSTKDFIAHIDELMYKHKIQQRRSSDKEHNGE
jgi:diguanylate cyclase (GGDEF)-like protein